MQPVISVMDIFAGPLKITHFLLKELQGRQVSSALDSRLDWASVFADVRLAFLQYYPNVLRVSNYQDSIMCILPYLADPPYPILFDIIQQKVGFPLHVIEMLKIDAVGLDLANQFSKSFMFEF